MYMSAKEASKVLFFSDRHIRRLCKKGQLKCEKMDNKWMIEIGLPKDARFEP